MKNNGLLFPMLPQFFRWHIVKRKDTGDYFVVIEKYLEYNQYTEYLSIEIREGLAGYPAQILTAKNVASAIDFAHRAFKDRQAKEEGERLFLGVVG